MPYTLKPMKTLKVWQLAALVIFGILFVMFLTTALLGDDWILWLYPVAALVGVAITLWDGPGRKERKQLEATERAQADAEEMERAKRLASKERKRRDKDDN